MKKNPITNMSPKPFFFQSERLKSLNNSHLFIFKFVKLFSYSFTKVMSKINVKNTSIYLIIIFLTIITTCFLHLIYIEIEKICSAIKKRNKLKKELRTLKNIKNSKKLKIRHNYNESIDVIYSNINKSKINIEINTLWADAHEFRITTCKNKIEKGIGILKSKEEELKTLSNKANLLSERIYKNKEKIKQKYEDI